MSKTRITLKILTVGVLFASIALLAISSLTGMLMNYLFVFLMISAAVMLVTLVVCVVKKRIRWNFAELESVRSFVTTGILRNATWIVIGACIYVAVLPIQFSSDDFTEVMFTIWGCVVLLCVLDWIPRNRAGKWVNATLCVFMVFSAYQLLMSTMSPRSAGDVELNPFANEDLYVFQGGNSTLINHHYFAGSQKYALDLIVADDGTLPLDQVTDLAQYATFGRELNSPIEGEVVAVLNTLPDQNIGETDLENLLGNHVVIRIDAHVFLLMAHLQQNSVLVSEGDTVQVGQRIAKIGNSGNTTQPHLHMQVMTDADFTNPNVKPLPFSIKLDDGNSRFFRRSEVVPARS